MHDAAKISLSASVVDSYYLVIAQRAQRDLLHETITNRAEQLEAIQRRYQSGVASPLDVYQAQENLAAAQAQYENVLGTLQTAENALTALIGHYPGTIDQGKLATLPRTVIELPAGMPAKLLLQRPDLKADYLQLKATDERVGEALAQHFPTINLGGTLGQSIDPSGFVWSIMAQVTAPIFQKGQIRANYLLKKAMFEERAAAFRATLIQAVKEVDDAVAFGRAAENRIEALKSRVTAAQGTVRLSIEQYTRGVSSYLNILTAERTLYLARAELINANRELISARVQLCRALGGGWKTNG